MEQKDILINKQDIINAVSEVQTVKKEKNFVSLFYNSFFGWIALNFVSLWIIGMYLDTATPRLVKIIITSSIIWAIISFVLSVGTVIELSRIGRGDNSKAIPFTLTTIIVVLLSCFGSLVWQSDKVQNTDFAKNLKYDLKRGAYTTEAIDVTLTNVTYHYISTTRGGYDEYLYMFTNSNGDAAVLSDRGTLARELEGTKLPAPLTIEKTDEPSVYFYGLIKLERIG
ncbi:MAG: hypothetical protein IJK26_10180 [Clostridia bacterium]|nr:hypothetical protein [Clostridia bacterium]